MLDAAIWEVPQLLQTPALISKFHPVAVARGTYIQIKAEGFPLRFNGAVFSQWPRLRYECGG